MAFKDPYPFLPGHLVDLKDGGLAAVKPEPDAPRTESVLLLGTATDGPARVAVACDPSSVNMWGKLKDANGIPNGATLLKGFEEVWRTGCRDVRMMRISGSKATLDVLGTPKVLTNVAPKTETLGPTAGNVKSGKFRLANPATAITFVKADSADLAVTTGYVKDEVGVAAAPDAEFSGPDDGHSTYVYTTLPAALDVNVETSFKVGVIANDQAGDLVQLELRLANAAQADNLVLKYQLEDLSWSTLVAVNGVYTIGAALGFALADKEYQFKITANAGMDISFTIDVSNATEEAVVGEVLAANGDRTQYTADHTFKNGAPLVVKADGVVLDSALYTVNVATITFAVARGEAEVITADYVWVPPDASLANVVKAVKAYNTITVLADACPSESLITVRYTYGAGLTATENSTTVNGVTTQWVANGVDQNLVLAEVPLAGTLSVAIDGAFLPSINYTINAELKQITLKATAKLPVDKDVVVKYSYNQSTAVTPKIVLETAWAGALYNDTKASVENVTDASGAVIGKKVIVYLPPSKVAGYSKLEYSSVKYPLFSQMIQAILTDLDSAKGIVRAKCAKSFENIRTDTLMVMPETNFAGGDDGLGLTKQQIFEALGGKKDPVTGEYTTLGAYQLLENYKVDYIIPLGVTADDDLPNPADSFKYQLGMACAVISHRSRVCHGIIPTSSPEDVELETINTHANHLVSEHPNDIFMKDADGNIIYDSEGQPFDLGRFVTVLAAPDVRFKHSQLGYYYTNSPAIYAGMICGLKVSSSPLNKAVPAIEGLRFEYGNAQRNTLTGARFVTYKVKDNGVVAVEDAITAAQPRSDYADLANLRSVKKAVDNVREVCDPYIGEPPSTANQNAMSAAIDKRLGKMKEDGEIAGYEFQIMASLFDKVLGRSSIELTIQPPGTLKRITTVVKVSPQL